jgi:hypothetical protein
MMTADRDRPYIIQFSHQKIRAVAATDPILWRESISAIFFLSRTYTIGSVAGKDINFVQLFAWTSLYLLFKHEKQNNLKQLRHVMRYLEPLGLFFSLFFFKRTNLTIMSVTSHRLSHIKLNVPSFVQNEQKILKKPQLLCNPKVSHKIL